MMAYHTTFSADEIMAFARAQLWTARSYLERDNRSDFAYDHLMHAVGMLNVVDSRSLNEVESQMCKVLRTDAAALESAIATKRIRFEMEGS